MSQHHDDDDVESLFRLAGRRSRLPEPEVEPIRAAAHLAWRRHVRRTVWTRRATVAGTALAAGLVLAIGLRLGGRSPVSAPAMPLAVLELQTGEVNVAGGHDRGRDGGPLLVAGSVVATSAEGRAALRLAAGPSLRLDVASAVRLDAADRLTLERGAVYLDADPAGHGEAITVVTPFGEVRHVGTQFEARLLESVPGSAVPALRVRVREGAVRVEREARSLVIEAGAELTLDAAGTARKTMIPAHDAGWAWTQRAAPALDIEGVTLDVFLAWVGRETGLAWRYADPNLERAAQGIVLHGSIAGFTPADALTVVLPGCGLRHRQLAQAWLLENDPRP